MKQKLLISFIVCICMQKMMAQTVAVADVVSVINEIPVPIYVLENDTYTCSLPIITITTPPLNGTVDPITAGDTVITYTSNTGYVGADQLTYTIACGGVTSTATVKIMVANKPENLIYSECFANPPANAFDMKQKYQVPNIHTMATPLVGDIDGDGIVEILAPMGVNNQAFYANGFTVVNGKTGAVKTSYSTVWWDTQGQAIAMADVDGDKKAELFIAQSQSQTLSRKIVCYDASTGALKSGFSATVVPDFKGIPVQHMLQFHIWEI